MPGHDIDFLKKQWKSAKPSADTARSLADISVSSLESARTLSHKVAHHHLKATIFSLLLPPLIIWLSFEVTLSTTLIITYSVYGLICAYINFDIYRNVKHSEYVSCTIVEAAQRVAKTKRLIGRGRIISTILMIPVLILFFVDISALGDNEMIYAGIIGAIIGAIVAAYLWLKLNKQLRKLREIFGQDT